MNSQIWVERTDEGRGLRLLGQRRTATAAAVQRVIDRQVWPPSCVAVIDDAMAPMETGPAPDRTLPGAGLHCLAGLRNTDPRVPPYMTTDAWRHKQHNTRLAGWTDLAHLLTLYTKTCARTAGMSLFDDRFHGYVEPSLVFFERLEGLVRETMASLDSCGFFAMVDSTEYPEREICFLMRRKDGPDFEDGQAVVDTIRGYITQDPDARPDRRHWQDLSDLTQDLLDLVRRELAGESQTRADAVTLRGLPMRLQKIILNTDHAIDPAATMGFTTVVASDRIFTNQCVQMAVGRPLTALVAVPDGAGRLYVCRGPIYSVHEIIRSADDPLSDESWREQDRFPIAGSPVPWIFSHPDLRWCRTMGIDELRSLARPDPRAASVDITRWGVDAWRRRSRRLAGVAVPDDLTDELVNVVCEPTTPPGLCMFLLEQLMLKSGRVATARRWGMLLDLAEARLDETSDDEMSPFPAIVVYWASQAAPRCRDTELAARVDALCERLGESVSGDVREALAAGQ